jgi:hypothetical protein
VCGERLKSDGFDLQDGECRGTTRPSTPQRQA